MAKSVVKGKVLGFCCYHGNSSSYCRIMKEIKLMELSIGPKYGCGCCRSYTVAAIATADHNL
jgi:hypothetical protein